VKPADVRFYIDADVLGLGKILANLRPDVTYPGAPEKRIKRRLRAACDLPVDAKDEVWIPRTATEGWVVITRDSNILQHRRFLDLIATRSARIVALAGSDALDTWAQLRVVMLRWEGIEALTHVPGPWLYTATLQRLTRRDLAPRGRRPRPRPRPATPPVEPTNGRLL
jgi:hypothetical protein